MEIIKAQWTTDGDRFNVDMPLTKIDKENRIVSGWATLDNDDRQGDRVTAEASLKAFEKFAGNIREMHQKVAVGRMVSYRPDSFYDPESKQVYNGIWVDAYISKGAEDTWQKILDGTLRAFSIKGPIKDYEYEVRKSDGKSVRIVKAYEMEELSVVDEGGNEPCRIMSIMKDVNGETVLDGVNTQMKSESVFFCPTDSIAKTSNEESVQCPHGHKMEQIGWIEYDDEVSKSAQIDAVISNYNDNAKQDSPATTEGGVDVAKKEEEKTDAPVAVDAGSTAPAVNPVVDDGQAKSEDNAEVANDEVVNAEVEPEEEQKVEKAADVSEVEVDEPDFAKLFDGFKSDILAGLEKSTGEAKAASESVKVELEKALAEVSEKVEALSKAHEEITAKFDGIQTELKSVEKSLAAVESDTAVKKSVDLGGSTEETLVKSKGGSKWGGHFLGLSALSEEK